MQTARIGITRQVEGGKESRSLPSLSHPLSGRAEEDLAYPRLSVNPGII